MSNTRNLIAALLFAALALPATAGGSIEPIAYDRLVSIRGDTGYRTSYGSSGDGFEYVDGDTGWQLAPRAFAWSGARLAADKASSEAVRAPARAMRDDAEASRLYPGG